MFLDWTYAGSTPPRSSSSRNTYPAESFEVKTSWQLHWYQCKWHNTFWSFSKNSTFVTDFLLPTGAVLCTTWNTLCMTLTVLPLLPKFRNFQEFLGFSRIEKANFENIFWIYFENTYGMNIMTHTHTPFL